MVSSVRYFSFKDIDIHRRQPFWVLLAIILLLKLFVAEPQLFLFGGFFLYILSGPSRSVIVRGRRMLSRSGLTSRRNFSSKKSS
jgi:CDP-diacylglycerol--serine O-phosphatidyltransferase